MPFRPVRSALAAILLASASISPAEPPPFGAAPLEITADPVDIMLDGLHEFLDRKTTEAADERPARWLRDLRSEAIYRTSIEPNRSRFKQIIGWIEPDESRLQLEIVAASPTEPAIHENDRFRVFAVRWGVMDGLDGEGLMLLPPGEVRAVCVALPDADQTPEELAGLIPSEVPCRPFAADLAREGFAVIIPSLINRRDDFSGNPRIGRTTNQPHREFIYRMAFELGHHIIGIEAAKAVAALRLLRREHPGVRGALAGYGEGGLIAFHAAAATDDADAVLVSGYFQPREQLWREPIYRNTWNRLTEFGDAEIAGMISARGLVIEDAAYPLISGPPPSRDGRGGAAPGALVRPSSEAVLQEFNRIIPDAKSLVGRPRHLVHRAYANGVPAGDPRSLQQLMLSLGLGPAPSPANPIAHPDAPKLPNDSIRQKRQFDQMVAFLQRELRYSATTRVRFAADVAPDLGKVDPSGWSAAVQPLREAFYNDVIGRFDVPLLAPTPRMRLVEDAAGYRVWEVMLDVVNGVVAYGWLLVPKSIAPGERRPVVVCQHGLEGRPADTLDPSNEYYRGFSRTIADMGCIVFAPQNPYIGEDRFRSLQRKLNPLGKSLFSIITLQHAQIINWLESLPVVDASRIAFYGLSYGGKTAMRVPAIETRYCLSICSADFNDWITKNATYESAYSYLFTGEYEIFEWNLGATFNYSDMAALIAPRPFMVERGHNDGVAPDEWVAAEFAKVRSLYDRLGIGGRAEIEFFNGPHQINAVGTLDFLRRHLSLRP